VGYQQILASPDDLEGAAVDTVVATRRFVRRQRSWFRRDRRIVWLAGESSGVGDRARAAIGASVR
jgi:tRNA dimethylallyltransferase